MNISLEFAILLFFLIFYLSLILLIFLNFTYIFFISLRSIKNYLISTFEFIYITVISPKYTLIVKSKYCDKTADYCKITFQILLQH